MNAHRGLPDARNAALAHKPWLPGAARCSEGGGLNFVECWAELAQMASMQR